MSGRNRDNEAVMISRKELRMLLFWAGWGIGHARGGSNIEYTERTIWNLSKDFKLPMQKPVIGKWLKK